ncbi:MAG: ABC transporter ATP-binding protein [Acetomicrobium sp.]|jgi:putative ABC transport system ATP-binding protein|uniref:ABC transporter ATP-binding protein n=1 Tax=Acetomicrobium TaxID=49894 RepID=UPI001696B884|nr:ABC transporter ATP-binding protein [Acetomicrobium mobile]MDI9376912.1 ABC transporter ATP-binding protein [Synergistota bacterium]NLI43301.1 ABC transporter ATP-binding protein [Synergistaceae bacterium]HOB10897.1 ABC transporter ATP-binding protein [Acetomicrobium sp.]HQA36197.1 ABC transporter ATP-binding protein [Acetomicrobium sp.]HQC87605.1 ABC transporter ATP-binding protein [Acetomicrobium sp.]
MPLIEVENVRKVYKMDGVEFEALRGVSFTVEKEEFVIIMGPSGSGKSTLMHILGALDVPTSGKYILNGKDITSMTKDELARVRNKNIGFIFQGFNLLPRMSALENVELPMLYAGLPAGERRAKARQALDLVGLLEWADHRPNQLSGGQQQRVAIARALVNDAPLLLADEPTGNLDSKTGVQVMETLKVLNENRGITIVLVTHDSGIARYGKRIVRVLDGMISSDTPEEQVTIR